MKSHGNEILAGVFIVIALLGLTVLLILVGDYKDIFAAKQEVRVEFHNIRGLKTGDPVYYAGLQIGTVKAINVVEKKRKDGKSETMMECVLEVNKKYTFHKDTTASVQATLTNIVSIQISPGTGEPIHPQPGQPIEIAAYEPMSMSELMAKGGEIVSQVQNTLKVADTTIREVKTLITNANNMLVKNKENINKTIANTRTISEKGVDISKQIQTLLAENRPKVNATVANLQASSMRMRETLDTVAPKVSSSMDTLQKSLDTLYKALSVASLMLQENRPDIRAIVANFREASEDMPLLTADLRRRPWRLLNLFGKEKPKDIRKMELADAARFLANASSDISETLDKLNVLMEMSKANPDLQEAIQGFMQDLKERDRQLRTLQEQLQKEIRKKK